MTITKNEVHDIKLTLTGKEGSCTIEELVSFTNRLKIEGFSPNDRIDIFGVSTNQKAKLVAERSVLYDNMDDLDRSVANLEA